jgi:hypothetical protein
LVTINGFKAAYAIKDGAEGPRGWMVFLSSYAVYIEYIVIQIQILCVFDFDTLLLRNFDMSYNFAE